MKTEFLTRMQELLKDEYMVFEKSLQEDRFRGLRVNTLKVDTETFQKEFPYEITPTPFAQTSYYLTEGYEHLGNHPLHLAGTFYMQEPSASSAVEILDPQPGDNVLDLCAAPGGKSTQIAGKLQNSGMLVSNEIDSKRAQILLSNMERLGVSEAMITNAHPDDLCSQFAGYFDKILVDAPCSGEGMVKKHSAAMERWSVEHVEACAKRQIQILHSAYQALKQDGVLVYSTCTYAVEENEAVVAAFLQEHPDMMQLDCAVDFGRCGFAYEGMEADKVRRIFPMDKGEGHFIAKFQKTGDVRSQKIKLKKDSLLDAGIKKQLDQIVDLAGFHYMLINEKLYCKQTPFFDIPRLKILRQGILCGQIVKNRIEPHQHLFVSACMSHRFKQVVNLEDKMVSIFLSGNVLPICGYRGYVAIAYQNHILGFGKGDGNVIKNKYPKGLRIAC